LRGSYGLFSASASAKFKAVTEKHNARVYCTVYAEGGPEIQISDPADPAELLELANTWMREMHDDPDKNARPYEWTAAPVTIAEGPLAPNSADLEHAQDVLQFCARQRAEMLDQLHLLNWWARHQDKYDWTDADTPEEIVKKAALTQKDLDLIADCASHAIDHPGDAKLPADFAPPQCHRRPIRSRCRCRRARRPSPEPRPHHRRRPHPTRWLFLIGEGEQEAVEGNWDQDGNRIPSASEAGLVLVLVLEYRGGPAVWPQSPDPANRGAVLQSYPPAGSKVMSGTSVTLVCYDGT
jgi:hypothetical protein